MTWPDSSWAFSSLLGTDVARTLAGLLCIAMSAGFVVGGVGLLASQTWWRPVIIGIAAASAGLFVLFWDGKAQMLSNKGLFAVLIDVSILVALLVLHWPRFEF